MFVKTLPFLYFGFTATSVVYKNFVFVVVNGLLLSSWIRPFLVCSSIFESLSVPSSELWALYVSSMASTIARCKHH